MWPNNSRNPTFQYNVVGGNAPAYYDSEAWDCDDLNVGTCTYQYNYSYGDSGSFFLDCITCAGRISATNVVLRYNIAQATVGSSSELGHRKDLHIQQHLRLPVTADR